jgi:DNA-directed RNA polymerase alpha subunit
LVSVAASRLRMTAKAENSEGNAKNVESDDEVSQPKLLDPAPELPDDTPISDVEFPARIRNVLAAAGLKTVGEVREISDETLLSFQDFGKGSVAHLRATLGLTSFEGVRPMGKKRSK